MMLAVLRDVAEAGGRMGSAWKLLVLAAVAGRTINQGLIANSAPAKTLGIACIGVASLCRDRKRSSLLAVALANIHLSLA
jgi:hypothetical protein